ncbi:MAG: TerC family protein [Planctomycetes bacterium]|nr:TerC family protein [Planctomycetota bacterium]
MLALSSPLQWGLFLAFIGVMLALDLGVFHKKAHVPSFREALGWTAVWATLAVCFGGWLGFSQGQQPMVEFYTGYVIELSLSMDNVFVFVLILAGLKIPREFQHRVLFWGVLTALVLRGAMILGGAALVAKYHFVLYGFGAFLVWMGLKLLFGGGDDDADGQKSEGRLMQFLRRRLRVTDELHGMKFFVVKDGKRVGTPLLLALIMVEISDVVFAVDSIPAIFAVTQDPFLVFTANVFAILGLRSLFFVLAGMLDRFRYLKYGLAIVLTFVGCKLLLLDVVHVDALLSLGIVVGVLGTSAVVSLAKTHHS